MQKTKFGQIGWAFAAALGAVIVFSGFQGDTNKIGVVDIANVIEKSDYGKKSQDDFQAMKAAREGVLEFIDEYRVLTVEQATKLRDLSLKPNPTAAEKAELDQLKTDIKASSQKQKTLTVKPNLTPEERQLLQDYANRTQQMQDLNQNWFRTFTNEMQSWADKQKLDSLTRARGAVQAVAKQQGFTVVFEVGVAPYGANDLTDAALKQMNATK